MKTDFQKKILKKIIDGEIKMKPKWKFELEKKSTALIWGMTVVVAAFSALSVLAFWDIYSPIDTLELGEVGRQLLMEDFPYLWLVAGVILLGTGVKLFSEIGDNYKKPMCKWLLITTITTTVLTILFRLLAG